MNPADVVVVITSTLVPNSKSWYGLSSNLVELSVDERCQHTLTTIQSLFDFGFASIYLLDNSIESAPSHWVERYKSLGVLFLKIPAKNKFTNNKGLSEIELLLDFLERVKLQSPILKISGRYKLNSINLLQIGSFDIIGRVFHRRRGFSEFSTKAYMVRNTIVWEAILKEAARSTKFLIYKFWTPYLFKRVMSFLKNVFLTRNFALLKDPEISIEEGFYYSFRSLSLKLKPIDDLGISGILAAEGKFVNE